MAGSSASRRQGAAEAELGSDPSGIERLAAKGPVILTEQGAPSLVVVGYEDFQRNYRMPLAAGPAPEDRGSAFDEDVVVARQMRPAREIGM